MALSVADQARAKDLWDAGMSSVAIAAVMGTTKNAIIGYAHRQGWEARPSPIKRAPAPAAPPSKPPPRLHPASVLANFGAAPVPEVRARTGGVTPAARTFQAASAESTPRVHATRTCEWPMWPDKERAPSPPLFCGAPVRMKRNLQGETVPCWTCAPHAKIAFEARAFGHATPGQIERLMQTAA